MACLIAVLVPNLADGRLIARWNNLRTGLLDRLVRFWKMD